MKHIRINLETTQTNHKSSVPLDVSYWEKLWDTYTTDFASIEIHCWKEENVHIQELSPIAAQLEDQGLVKSFTITLNNENRNYLRNHSIDENGGLKWFTVFFYKEGIQIIEIGQYGSEIAYFGIDKNEAEEFQRLFAQVKHAEYFEEHVM